MTLMLFLKQALGLDHPILIPLCHMIARGIIVFLLGILVARLNKKLLGIHTPFNFILFIMLGSIFASAIMDERQFVPIIITTLVLMGVNRVISMLVFRLPKIEQFVKGSPVVLVQDSKIDRDAMRTNFITERELYHELHSKLFTHDLSNIKQAILESDGSINFIQK